MKSQHGWIFGSQKKKKNTTRRIDSRRTTGGLLGIIFHHHNHNHRLGWSRSLLSKTPSSPSRSHHNHNIIKNPFKRKERPTWDVSDYDVSKETYTTAATVVSKEEVIPDRGEDYRGSYGNDRCGGGSYRSNGDYGDHRSYNRSQSYSGPPQINSRWNNVESGGDGGGGRGGYNNDRRSSYGGGGRRNEARINERGFHGDMRPDKRLEKQLFAGEERQTTGINFDNYDKIHVESAGNDIPEPINVYTEETIGLDLYRNTQLCGYSKPTPVQKYSVQIGSAGRDLMACAQTGSGMTAGFLFPIIMAMVKNGGQDPPENARCRVYPKGLILVPTRELASQIHDKARRFTYCIGIVSVVVYGGADVREQLRQIERGCDMLVATPERLVDLIERGRLAMDNICFLVLDEADRILGKCTQLTRTFIETCVIDAHFLPLDMGLEPQIRRIVEEEGMPQEIWN